MFKIGHKKAQAASELAVFGAILIFVLGTIVRSAVGNNYAQNQNFKAMRMALLSSWEGAKASETGATNTAHNSASILFLEDRLSPDLNKYGDQDRTPYMANGSGSFTFELLYPMDPNEVATMLPIMDVFINGQHFPFTTSSYVRGRKLLPTVCTAPPNTSGTLSPQQCQQNQCIRNESEWIGGTVLAGQFESIVPMSVTPRGPIAKVCQIGASGITSMAQEDACIIFTQLSVDGEITVDWSKYTTMNMAAIGTVRGSELSVNFVNWYDFQFPGVDQGMQIGRIQSILRSNVRYKLFYAMAVNGAVATDGTPQFSVTPPTCSSHPCKNKELSSDVPLTDSYGNPTVDDEGNTTNIKGDMSFDLQRLRVYNTSHNGQVNPTYISARGTSTSPSRRPYMAWEWYATAATSADMIGLDVSNNIYPQWDIDGRLNPVTIYNFSLDSSGVPVVDYEDPQGGDIDGSWDSNSCSPKPGLQSDAEIYTFTKAGTYLLVKEGKMYNPETDQFVRSVNKRDTINLVTRLIQLSNNTGRFCTIPSNGSPIMKCGAAGDKSGIACANPNPVEVCLDSTPSGSGAVPPNCSSTANISRTCFDNSNKMLYVRSRIEDRRGRFWFTNASGQVQVK